MTIQANQMGDVRKSYNKSVAASQTIRRGDAVTIAAGQVSKAVIGAALIEGFACHDVTTGATFDPKIRLIYDKATSQEFRGMLLSTVAVQTTTALEGTDVGFAVEGGLFKVDPAAVVKQATVVKVSEPYDKRHVTLVVKAAFRQGLI